MKTNSLAYYNYSEQESNESRNYLSVVRENSETKNPDHLAMERALKLANIAVWEFCPNGERYNFSESFAEMLGYEGSEMDTFGEFNDPDFLVSLIHPEDAEAVLTTMAKIHLGQLKEINCVARLKRRNGEYVAMKCTGLRFKSETKEGAYLYSGRIEYAEQKKTVEQERKKLSLKLKNVRRKQFCLERESEMLVFIFNLFGASRNINYVMKSIAEKISEVFLPHEEITAKIIYNDREHASSGFVQTPCSVNFAFQTFNGKNGFLELYSKTKGEKNSSVLAFTETQALGNKIATMLKNWIEKHETEKNLENMLVDLEAKIETRTEDLKSANHKLMEINRDINDSIYYARRIQNATLPDEKTLQDIFPESFIFYKPKDIVSGDFYWFHQSDSKTFYVCADCTGHGVPGALMSMVGTQLLDYIIIEKNISEPETILKEMDKSISKFLNKNQSTCGLLRDGMAISLCVIDKDKQVLSFAGACNDAYLFSGEEMTILKADRHAIGGNEMNAGKNFWKTEVNYKKNDKLYMFTDGFPDQFGGDKGKKLLKKNLLEYIAQTKNENMERQKKSYENMFQSWKGSNFQVDDITMLGIEL